jgi:hypothetical protein
MNEPIERAQEITGKVTARQLLAVVRAGERLYMHGKAVYNRPSYSDAFTFEVSAPKKTNGVEITARIEVPGYVSNGETSERKVHTDSLDGHAWTTYCNAFRPTSGFWHIGYGERIRDVLELLPGDAEVSFHVYLDAGTNELLVCAETSVRGGRFTESGLHSDHLYLVAECNVRGKKRERRFLIDVSTGAHNSARFGYQR